MKKQVNMDIRKYSCFLQVQKYDSMSPLLYFNSGTYSDHNSSMTRDEGKRF